MSRCALTTIDNPYNPFTQFSNWFVYDVVKGHNSCGLLARIARTSDQLSDGENDKEIERAINEIIEFDLEDKFIKVSEDDEIRSIPTGV